MNESKQVRVLFEFIKSNFDQNSWEHEEHNRRKYLGNFATLQNFYQHQQATLAKMKKNDLSKLTILMELIQGGMKNMDMDVMIPFESNGFCFDINGVLILFNER